MFIKVFYRNIHNSKGETIQLCSKSVSRLPVLHFCHTPTYSSWFSCLKSLWNMNTKMGNNCLFPVKLRQSRSWQNNVDTIAIRGLSALSHNLDQQMEVPTCSNLYSSYRVMHKALRVIWSDFWIDRLGIIIETNVKNVNVKDANIMSIQLE